MINAHNFDPEDLNTQVNTLAQRLTKISQRAEETLFATGGALELSKYCWYALTWRFDARGNAHASRISDSPSSIELISGNNLLQKNSSSQKRSRRSSQDTRLLYSTKWIL